MPRTRTSTAHAAKAPARSPLVAACFLALAIDASSSATAIPAPADPASVVVTNCDDSGPGSLRDVAGTALDGETVDLTQLSCSVISLTTGAILLGSQDLTLLGPGAHGLLLQGATPGAGVIYDLGGGTLTIRGIDVAGGHKYRSDHAASGGCIHATGNLDISDAHVFDCAVHTVADEASGGALYASGFITMASTVVDQCSIATSGSAKGGGVSAGTDVLMLDSRVSGCHVVAGASALGGGVHAGGNLMVKYSTLADNDIADSASGIGGGGWSGGDAVIYWSTVSGNRATVAGALYMARGDGSESANIGDSTISGNSANMSGGIRSAIPLELHNSTIAFNWMPRPDVFPIDESLAGGLSVLVSPVVLGSSIIAGNFLRGDTDEPADVGGDHRVAVEGSANLIGDSSLAVPPDTIGDDPMLAPLRANGGPTQTHALLPGSPAISRGDAGTLLTDQRGTGYPRTVGAQADIGSYEVDPERIFGDGFE
jgi:hypothetical protein